MSDQSQIIPYADNSSGAVWRMRRKGAPMKKQNYKEQDLVAQLRDGDERATEKFVRENSGWMLAVARRYVRDEALAEDCVQDAFFRAFRKIDDFKEQSTLKSWLHRIVVNSALMKLRSLKREDENTLDGVIPEFDENGHRLVAQWQDDRHQTPQELMERNTLRRVILAEIDKLPDRYRSVLLLKDIEELSTAEVANVLELSEGNVRIRLHRARTALKKRLEPVMESRNKA